MLILGRHVWPVLPLYGPFAQSRTAVVKLHSHGLIAPFAPFWPLSSSGIACPIRRLFVHPTFHDTLGHMKPLHPGP
jgi:hypothetical protein